MVLAQHPGDLVLLSTLVDLAEWNIPPDEVIRYQQRVCELRPWPTEVNRLARLLIENRDYD